jgi:hypothetical protein
MPSHIEKKALSVPALHLQGDAEKESHSKLFLGTNFLSQTQNPTQPAEMGFR